MKNRLAILLFSLIGAGIGLSIRPAINVLREFGCNMECKAQLLYKNPAFFEVRGAISNIKKDSITQVTFNQSKYTTEYLDENGIDLLIVMNSGDFVMTSRLEKLAMLAKPTFENGRLIWRCQFFSKTITTPSERACSYQ